MLGHETMGMMVPSMELPKEYFQVNDLLCSSDGFPPGTEDYIIENQLHKLSVVNERIDRANQAAFNYNQAAKNLTRAGLMFLGVSLVSSAAIATSAAIGATIALKRKKKEEQEKEAREAENG